MKSQKFSKLCVRALAASLAAAALVLASGCVVVAVGAAGAAGAGTVAYIRGEIDATLGNGYDQVVDASDRALAQLQFTKVSETKDALSAVIVGRTAEDKKIRITITREGDALTKVQIRIGVFGDEERSMAILDKIRAGL
jgi:hypothetical protein